VSQIVIAIESDNPDIVTLSTGAVTNLVEQLSMDGVSQVEGRLIVDGKLSSQFKCIPKNLNWDDN